MKTPDAKTPKKMGHFRFPKCPKKILKCFLHFCKNYIVFLPCSIFGLPKFTKMLKWCFREPVFSLNGVCIFNFGLTGVFVMVFVFWMLVWVKTNHMV